MSSYRLIKATSRAMRLDTITDLRRINEWLWQKGHQAISCYGPSVRALENSIALGLEKLDTAGLAKLERGESFYRSILPEITDKERSRYNKLNQAKKIFYSRC